MLQWLFGICMYSQKGPLQALMTPTQHRNEGWSELPGPFISWLHSGKTAARLGAAYTHQLPSLGLIMATLPELIHTSQATRRFFSFPVVLPRSVFLSVWWSTSSRSLCTQKGLPYLLPCRSRGLLLQAGFMVWCVGTKCSHGLLRWKMFRGVLKRYVTPLIYLSISCDVTVSVFLANNIKSLLFHATSKDISPKFHSRLIQNSGKLQNILPSNLNLTLDCWVVE